MSLACCGDSSQIECDGKDDYGVVLSGTERASTDVTRDFWHAHRSEILEIKGLGGAGVASCCEGWEGPSSECISLEVQRFAATRDELRATLREIQQSDPSYADHELLISVKLVGPTGPRCPKGKCGPVPYDGLGKEQTPPAPSSGRLVLDRVRMQNEPACQDDGECVPTGCLCEHWMAAGATSCYLDGEIDPVDPGGPKLCGCVDSRCAKFTFFNP